MKRPILYPKKFPKKYQDDKDDSNSNKKTVSIEQNNFTLLNFFKITSMHKSTSINKKESPRRQVFMRLKRDKTDPNQNYRLSKYNIGKPKKKKKSNIKRFLKKPNNNNDNNKIDISNFVLFSEKYCDEIKNIFENNFIRNFKSYLDTNFNNDRKNISRRHDLNISKNTFNEFIQQIFELFIEKYLLNTYNKLIYISKNYLIDNNNDENNYNEVELLSYNEKENIYLEYSPINIQESNLFYPELSSTIVKFIKNFSKKKLNKMPNCALLLYRPSNDFSSYINKIRLICDQMGYNLLVKENEINKLMSFEKLKLINQNYIIGSLKDKNKKYLEIIEAVANTDKWKKFVEENDIYSLIEEEKIFVKNINRTQMINNIRNKKMSKSQSCIHTTQNLSKKMINKKNKANDILSNTILTFIGHNSNEEINSQQNNDNNNSKAYNIAKDYQQNILEKFNKRRNLILFVDNFEENEDNIKYVNQINSLIPNSKSPIIILTNNLPLFTNNLIIGNTSFQTRYIPHQIENEGIIQKENIIYITFLIIYFISFFPNFNLKKEIKLNDINNKDINNNFSFNRENIADNSQKESENNDYILKKIKKSINEVFININLNTYNNELYSSFISLSNIISIKNNYELDNILVYLKNLFLFINMDLKRNYIKQNPLNIITSLQNKVLQEIEDYKVNEDININNEDLLKLNDICEQNSFSDYEYGIIDNIGEKEYEAKMKNYGINNGVDFNKESFFYINEFYEEFKDKQLFNYISNVEVNERIVEDYKFYHTYYNSSDTILNHSDINKLNIMLTQIIINERISPEDISRFIGIKNNKRNNYRSQNINHNNNKMKEKISLLNKLFNKCSLELFNKYINAHIGINYYIEFLIDNKKYYIPDKLLFFNYYNDYYLMEQINSEQKNRFYDDEEDEYSDEYNEDEEYSN